MKRFINDDIEVQQEAIKAVKIEQKKFKRLLLKKWFGKVPFKKRIKCKSIDDYICCGYNKEWKKDISSQIPYLFDFENMSLENEKETLIGLRTLYNGLTFLGITAGGDWEHPIFFIVYFDGKDFKPYVPRYGNAINLDTNTAFGSETEADDEILEQLYKKYKEYGLVDIEMKKMISSKTQSWTKVYIQRYNIDNENHIEFNWTAIEEDILNNVII